LDSLRRVQRILHPKGLNISGNDVLIVAFNRVISKQLKSEIDKLLSKSLHSGNPVVRTIHSLCLQVIDVKKRILLPHEQEDMIYDILCRHSVLGDRYTFYKANQALRDHIAGHYSDMQLWQAVNEWLRRHQALLISDLPALLLDKIKGGDFQEKKYRHVIVDEFQDLTQSEQVLVYRLKSNSGSFLALGDPRQSIYRFRGNNREGLSKIENIVGEKSKTIKSINMTECHRCPEKIVLAANQLMGLYEAEAMTPINQDEANLHLVTWIDRIAESEGMAKAIVDNIHANPQRQDSPDQIGHLAMVTRRQFGYKLREEIKKIDSGICIDISFSESLLESWAVREAFLLFCLIVDPDAPTIRAWLGYQKNIEGKSFKAPKRNADAYLKLLEYCSDNITLKNLKEIALSETQPPGKGGKNIWERAKRYIQLRDELNLNDENVDSFFSKIFNIDIWIENEKSDPGTAELDMDLLLTKSKIIFNEILLEHPTFSISEILKRIARRLRYQIATREPFSIDEHVDLHIATLWGAKGMTADHVYILGLCDEAVPGKRRKEYPGTDNEYDEEQRRLFYVSLTRSRKTLVLSRFRDISTSNALILGLNIKHRNRYQQTLEMTTFIRDINSFLPESCEGNNWRGCVS